MRSLRQVFYVSRADSQLTEQDVRQILAISQRNNRQKDITGCLLYSGNHFAQVLEGERAKLDALVTRIANDVRHVDVIVVLDREISRRSFPNWSMGVVYSLDLADQLEALLSRGHASEQAALELFDEIHPDAVMGTL